MSKTKKLADGYIQVDMTEEIMKLEGLGELSTLEYIDENDDKEKVQVDNINENLKIVNEKLNTLFKLQEEMSKFVMQVAEEQKKLKKDEKDKLNEFVKNHEENMEQIQQMGRSNRKEESMAILGSGIVKPVNKMLNLFAGAGGLTSGFVGGNVGDIFNFDEPMDFSNYKLTCNIDKILALSGKKQTWLATKTSIPSSTLNSIINNRNDVSLRNAFKISKVLGVSIEELFSYEE